MCKERVEPLEPKEDRRKLYPEIAHRNAMQQDFEPPRTGGSHLHAVRAGEDKKSHHPRLARTLCWSLMIKRERMAGQWARF